MDKTYRLLAKSLAGPTKAIALLECVAEEVALAQTAWTYCKEMLPKVSRTFALNIAVLTGELHRAVLLAYLWCRIIDTVEDAPLLAADRKQRALLDFAKWIEGPMEASDIGAWSSQLSDLDGTEDELDLLENVTLVAECFAELSVSVRSRVVPSVAEMARGMAEYQSRPQLGKTEFLRDEADLDRYCYFVAGTVGVFLTELFCELGRIAPVSQDCLKEKAVPFGLGLQLTNITKDIMVDLSRGWCYVPETMMVAAGVDPKLVRESDSRETATRLVKPMVHKAHGHLRDAFEYTLALPRHWRQARLFCLWPLFMALETLVLLSRPDFQHQDGVSPKISRQKVRQIVRRTTLGFWSNTWLKREFSRLSSCIDRVS